MKDNNIPDDVQCAVDLAVDRPSEVRSSFVEQTRQAGRHPVHEVISLNVEKVSKHLEEETKYLYLWVVEHSRECI